MLSNEKFISRTLDTVFIKFIQHNAENVEANGGRPSYVG